jgi:plastocyanin
MAQPAAATATQYTNGVPTVHMNAENFTQPIVTISTGSRLLLVDDVPVEHILANGSWENGKVAPAHEPGAPAINVQVNDSSATIGPFTTAGTYHIYCTVHPGMELTVIVQ